MESNDGVNFVKYVEKMVILGAKTVGDRPAEAPRRERSPASTKDPFADDPLGGDDLPF